MICILHRYPKDEIKATNAAFPYLLKKSVVVRTYKRFNRLNPITKLLKSLMWIFYAPMLVIGRNYKVIYCDDSFPFYPLLVKLVSPKSKVVIRLGDLHLMYYCSGIVYELLHLLERLTWNSVDKILAISTTMQEYLEKETTTQVETILDPVDLSFFKPTGIQHVGKRVMWHGLITKNKCLDVVLEAAKQLPAIEFWIVGDGPDRKRLQAKATDNVFFTGWRKFELIPLYIDMCDIGLATRGKNPGNEFVVTSNFLQYGALAKPCIVSSRKVFDDIEYPYQFRNARELVSLIRYLLEAKEDCKNYIYLNHNAKEIASQIWSALSY